MPELGSWKECRAQERPDVEGGKDTAGCSEVGKLSDCVGWRKRVNEKGACVHV